MAFSVSSQSNPYVDKIITATTALAAGDKDIFSGAGANCFIADMNNSNNAQHASYLKLYDGANPTIGTTEPDLLLKAPKATRQTVTISDGISLGAALSFNLTKNPATSDQTNATNSVAVRIMAE